MWLLLSACLYENTRPYADFLEDLGRTSPSADSADTGQPPIDTDPPVPLFEACTTPGGTPQSVTFVNASDVPADLYFVDASCVTFNRVFLLQGDTATFDTASGEAWRLRDAFGLDWIGEIVIGQSPVGLLEVQ